MSEHPKAERYPMIALGAIGIWLLLFGVWPFVAPKHSLSEVYFTIDVILHLSGLAIVAFLHWYYVRRHR